MATKDKDKRREQDRRYRQKNKEAVMARQRGYSLKYLAKNRVTVNAKVRSRTQKLAEIKLDRGCAVCGYREHPDALHFDHLPEHEKKDAVSKMYHRKWSDVLEEIAKCQVLCANCHAIETASRRRAAKEAKRAAGPQLELKLG